VASGDGCSSGRRGSRAYVELVDLHRHLEPVFAAAEQHTLERRHVAVVTSPRGRDVSPRRILVVGRIEVEPAAVRRVSGEPGVRRIGAAQLRTPERRRRLE